MGRRNKVDELDDFLDEAIKNIRHDRAITKTLLTDILIMLQKSKDQHRDVGPIAAKYVETLQRSNEQLVKITAILSKKVDSEENLTEKDREELFDLIKENTG
jgi:hypothetical protein